MSDSGATSWAIRVRWGNQRLHAETLDRDGRTELTLGDGPKDDVALGSNVRAELKWTEVGLQVVLSPGFTGKAQLRGDRPVPVASLLTRGAAVEQGDGLRVLLEPRDAMWLQTGGLDIEVQAARAPVRRWGIDVKVLAVLGLGVFAVLLILASVVL